MVSILAIYFTRLSLFRGFKNDLSVVISLVVVSQICGLTNIVKLIYQKMKICKKTKTYEFCGFRVAGGGCLN